MLNKLCLVAFVFCVISCKNVFSLVENNNATNVCSEEIKVGPCKAGFVRYGFNEKEKKCVQFTYGGCHANGNNFQTFKECLETCKPTCLKPLVGGICRAIIPRFGFSSEQEKCVKFDYGGCQGNENNFETLTDCQTECEAPNVYKKIVLDDQ